MRPVTRDPGRSGNKSKNPENLAKLRCGCVGDRMGAAQEDFLKLQPGTVLLLVEKLFRGVRGGSACVREEPDSTRLAAAWMLAPSDASRNRTLPGWQRWMLAPSDASRNRTLPGWQRWMLAPSDASRNRTLPG